MSPYLVQRAYRAAHRQHHWLERRLAILLRWRAVGPGMDLLVMRHQRCHRLIARIELRSCNGMSPHALRLVERAAA